MLIVAGTATFHSVADMETVLGAGQAMIAASLAEAGCQDYTYARDVTDDKTMRIFELWDDQAALDAHFQEPHMGAFNAALGKVKIASISVKIYDVSGVRDLI
ncbi:putative quinol monooxygenase [Pyruvatibacter sp.]|uniref:putative quinol monooxygenase n=1 Tax=Pyruvatibacter sp. TaxID=1981328 RepID=UPI0032ECAB24